MSQTRFESWHLDLQDLLGLAVPPIAIAFIDHLPAGIGRIERTMPPATTDGRTGPVAASCVFWIEGTRGVFTTKAALRSHSGMSKRSCPDTLQEESRRLRHRQRQARYEARQRAGSNSAGLL
jgi:hypothetical protein